MFSRWSRIVLGMVISPLLLVVVWTIPYRDHSAFHKWMVINIVGAYVAFAVTALICHFILRALKWTKAWQYALVMFAVAFVSALTWALYGLGGYESLYYARTQVVEHGNVTSEGYILKITESVKLALLMAGTFVLFWLVSVRKRVQIAKDDA